MGRASNLDGGGSQEVRLATGVLRRALAHKSEQWQARPCNAGQRWPVARRRSHLAMG